MTDRKRPKSSSWSLSFLYQTSDFGEALVFRHEDGSLALSSLGCIKEEKTDEPHLEWIISFSGAGGTVLPNKKIKQYLKDFSFSDAEEDNHEPGFARKFFLAVEEKHRKKCECKDEEQVRLSKNYIYSRKKKQ
jgi:hypothetical protein